MTKKGKKQRRQTQHRRESMEQAQGSSDDEDSRKRKASLPASSIQNQSTFGSRKRTLEQIHFVYPKGEPGLVTTTTTTTRPYTFGVTKQEDPANFSDADSLKKSSSAADTGTSRTKESLEEILYRTKKQGESAKDATPMAPTVSSYKVESDSTIPIAQSHDDEPSYSSSSSAAGHLSGMSVEDAVRDKAGCRPRANSTDGELRLPQRGLCDEQMVLENHKWKQNGCCGGVPKGFLNLGNTCFLNSTLQCLAYLPPFCQSLMDMPSLSSKNGASSENQRNQGKRITIILRNLFRQVHGAKNQTGGAIMPRAIVTAVPLLSASGSRTGYKFRPGRQEDAHEFLVHLLDAMNHGELREAGINQNSSGWRDRLPIPRLDETTFVHRVFGGYLRSQVKCTHCGYCSNTYDPFLDLSLQVSQKSCQSVAHAFMEYTRKETLDSKNKWKCSGCKKLVCAQKQLTVFRPPLSLCLQLKRFSYSGLGFGGGGYRQGYGSGGGRKISKPIQFLAQMNLALSDGRSCAYALSGVVIHVGGSASSGHYTAYVKKPGAEKWYSMDDSFVEPVSERTVLQQRDAYILFYSRQEVKLEFPSPPIKSMSAHQARELGRSRERSRSDSFSEQTRGVAQPSSDPENQLKGMTLPSRDDSSESSASEASLTPPIMSINSQTLGTDTPRETASSGADDESPPSKLVSNSGSQKPAHLSSATGDASETDQDEESPTNRTRKIRPLAKVKLPSDKCSSSPSSSPESDSGDSEDDALPVSARPTAGTSPTEAERESPSENDSEKISDNSDDASSSDASPAAIAIRERSNKLANDIKSENTSSSCSNESTAAEESESDVNETSPEALGSHTTNNEKGLDRKRLSFSSAGDDRKPGSSDRKAAHKPTMIVVDRGAGQGKIAVMLGPRRNRKAWVPKISSVKTDNHSLLGNVPVDRWTDKVDGVINGDKMMANHQDRSKLVQQIEKKESSRKRKMFLDRWDAALDQGRVSANQQSTFVNRYRGDKLQLTRCFFVVVQNKKVKKEKASAANFSPQDGKKNAFQRIQSGIQSMNRGRAKGYVRQQKEANKHRR
jgi:ubiquitin C-terminal hydrolase